MAISLPRAFPSVPGLQVVLLALAASRLRHAAVLAVGGPHAEGGTSSDHHPLAIEDRHRSVAADRQGAIRRDLHGRAPVGEHECGAQRAPPPLDQVEPFGLLAGHGVGQGPGRGRRGRRP